MVLDHNNVETEENSIEKSKSKTRKSVIDDALILHMSQMFLDPESKHNYT